MPNAPDPESLPSSTDILEKYLVDPRTPDAFRELIKQALKTPIPFGNNI